MTTVREVIPLAMELANILNAGEEPSSDELTRGLQAFQSMMTSMVANGMFGALTDCYETEDYEASEGERVTAPAGVIVTFPTTVEADGEERAPRDLSCIETIINGVRIVKVYDRTGWVELTNLTLNSTAPFAERGLFGLAARLATFGAFIAIFRAGPVDDAVVRLAHEFNGALAGKHGTTQDHYPAEYF